MGFSPYSLKCLLVFLLFSSHLGSHILFYVYECLHACKCTVCAQCQQRPEVGTRSFETRLRMVLTYHVCSDTRT